MENEAGKLQHSAFEEVILNQCGFGRKEVSVGPGFGVDVSVVELSHGLALASTSDPLSLVPSLGLEESAWLSVYLMANDMATTGFAPQYAQFVLNLPAQFSREDFKTYWGYIHTFCKDIQLAITGGHTGFIEGQNSTIAGGGTFTTIAPKDQLLVSKFAKPSNVILATKSSAIAAASILALSFPETVKNKLGKEVYDTASGLFYKTSSLNDALVAAGTTTKYPEVTAMHDVTEGGLLGAIYEMAIASQCGALVYNDQLPIGHAQLAVCSLFSIDPRYVVGAGSMIIAVEKDHANAVIGRLQKAGIDCTVVGEMKEKSYGIKLLEKETETNLVYLEKDPYWEAFFNAYKKGWK